MLGWRIVKVSLPLRKGNKRYKERERPKGKCLEISQVFFNSVFINNKGPIHTLKGRTFFFITITKKFIIQITWNAILYHWHQSPSINYGKLLVLFFLKIFSAPTCFSFFLWFAPDDSSRENIKTLTAHLHLMDLF